MDDLGKCKMSAVRHEVEALRLDARGVHCHPFHVVSCQLSVGRRLRLLADGVDRFRAIDGLFRAGHVGQPSKTGILVSWGA